VCAISGFLLQKSDVGGTFRFKQAMLRFDQIMSRCTERGRDSWGMSGCDTNGDVWSRKAVGKYQTHSAIEIPNPHTQVVIGNLRAEPTTEYVANKTTDDIQPFANEGWVVAHNGIIANDKQLAAHLGIRPNTRIDSAVLPFLFAKVGFEEGLKNLVGSWAIAAYQMSDPKTLYLATNYKPLAYTFDRDTQTFFFASMPEYLSESFGALLEKRNAVLEVPPYTMMVVTPLGIVRTVPLLRSSRTMPLIVCSGGLDSTVAAAMAIDEAGSGELLHFDYGCRATPNEVKAIQDIADFFHTRVTIVKTEVFTDNMKSRLLGNEPVAQGDAGVEFAHEWVPARNLIMLAIATGIAESRECTNIVLGNNLEESGAYPDNEMIFMRKFNALLPFATRDGTYLRADEPVGNLMKHEIVAKGLEYGAPMELTWSCYEHGEHHCGKCGPCTMRRIAFKINKVKDPAFKHEWSDPYWSDCADYVREPVTS
jgi:7-cyano-7-deazaguanine synthase